MTKIFLVLPPADAFSNRTPFSSSRSRLQRSGHHHFISVAPLSITKSGVERPICLRIADALTKPRTHRDDPPVGRVPKLLPWCSLSTPGLCFILSLTFFLDFRVRLRECHALTSWWPPYIQNQSNARIPPFPWISSLSFLLRGRTRYRNRVNNPKGELSHD